MKTKAEKYLEKIEKNITNTYDEEKLHLVLKETGEVEYIKKIFNYIHSCLELDLEEITYIYIKRLELHPKFNHKEEFEYIKGYAMTNYVLKFLPIKIFSNENDLIDAISLLEKYYNDFYKENNDKKSSYLGIEESLFDEYKDLIVENSFLPDNIKYPLCTDLTYFKKINFLEQVCEEATKRKLEIDINYKDLVKIISDWKKEIIETNNIYTSLEIINCQKFINDMYEKYETLIMGENGSNFLTNLYLKSNEIIEEYKNERVVNFIKKNYYSLIGYAFEANILIEENKIKTKKKVLYS